MRVAKIQLKNIACFEDLSLDFMDGETSEPAPWVILLGENGAGKSTLLQMIGATLLNGAQIAAVAGNIDWHSYIRSSGENDQYGECRLILWPVADDAEYEKYSPATSVNLMLSSNHVRTQVSEGPWYQEQVGWFICGYGTSRRITGQVMGDRGAIPTLHDSAKPFRFASLFGNASGMTDVSDWLAGLYFSSIHPNRIEHDVRLFESARTAILRALPHISNLEVTKDRQVLVTEGTMRVPLERLSDGYRGTLAWIGDLIRRLFDAYPFSPDPLKKHGVVLIDEIDMHLHPRWQRSVVEDIRKLFPNLQFIVTTHSPFVAQDMRPQDRIVVLERSGRDRRGPVIARQEPGVLQDWSADQILAAYFGLSRGTRGDEALRIEARYERLLDAEAMGTLTDAERADLERLRTRIDRIPVGVTSDEQAFERAADNAIALLRQRRQALEAERQNVQPAPASSRDQGKGD
jgi:energy-coupling factor transporter ATP-binding protein EcfA2